MKINSNILKLIKNSLCYCSGLSFQNKSGIILNEYYSNKGMIFHNPNPAGGDDKNDGWVKGKGIYYQFYAPVQYPSSFEDDVLSKFETDAKGLFKKIYIENLWEKPLNKFIMIVNTRDQSLPKDSSNRADKCIQNLNLEYRTSTIGCISNVDYLLDLVLQLDENSINNLLIKLEIDSLVDYTNFDEVNMYNFLDKLSSELHSIVLSAPTSVDYKRISSENKITLNNLGNLKDRINLIISKLCIVEKAVSIINKNEPGSDIVGKSILFIVDIYRKYKNNYLGIDLYKKIIEEILLKVNNIEHYSIPAEFLVVYVFDRCDIFEKDANYDSPK